MKLDCQKYSLSEAVQDLRAYEFAGSIPGALKEAFEATESENAKATKELISVSRSNYVKDEAGDMIHEFWKPGGTEINKVNESKINKFLKKNKIEESIPYFIRSEEYSTHREIMVKEFELGSK